MAKVTIPDGFLDGDPPSRWAATSIVATRMADVLVEVLACSPFGAPVNDVCSAEPEILTALLPGPALRTACAGGVFVAVNRVFFHGGDLQPLSSPSFARKRQHSKIDHDPIYWGCEISMAAFRSVQSTGGWGGLGIGSASTPIASLDIQGDIAMAINSDALAMMLAQEYAFRAQPIAKYHGGGTDSGLFAPAQVDRFEYRNGVVGNIVGWGRGTPMRVHLADSMLPCESDCLYLAGGG